MPTDIFEGFDLQLFADEPPTLPDDSGQAGGAAVPEGDAGEPPGEPVVEIDGQQVPLSEVRRWRDTRQNLEQYYYTKLNEVAQQQQRMQPAVQLYQALQQRPDVAKAMLEMFKKSPEEMQQQPDESYDEYLARMDRIEQRLNETMSYLQRQEQLKLQEEARRQQEAAYKELESELSRLKEKYKDFDETMVLTEAYNRNMTDLEAVYYMLRGRDIDSIKRQAVQEYLDQKKQQSAPKTLPGGGGMLPSGYTPPKNLAEARRATMDAILGRLQGE